MKLYKFLHTNLKSKNGNIKWHFGKWRKFNGILEMCKSGFHCSIEPYDAFKYVQGEILAQVEARGKHLEQDDKQVWEEMRIIKAWKWDKKASLKLAIYSAELVLPNYEKERPNDLRPRQAIEAAKRVLFRDTAKNRATARAAESAARLAAWSAAESAAWSAARSAESAARSEAWSAELATTRKIQRKFMKITKELKPYKKNLWTGK